ncbi:MAG: septum formation protein Maf [Bacteroidetes bacterium]|nr:MAG: septum formation protein Maf [Bacteroidota bacterium]RLD48291.1 MAG: septum formation protein Maf [Bacteroidota bacterium]
MLENTLKGYDIVLASASPRRRQLLQELGIRFRVQPKKVEENFDEQLAPVQVAEYLSKLKARAFSKEELEEKTIVITADTVVTIDGMILGKPKDPANAREMLQQLSGRSHQVITGVTLRSAEKMKTFSVSTKVFFKELSNEEIEYYITRFKPFDKAGAYGIQEWIGHAAIERIEGSYFNVMGLPVHRLYEELLAF